jgi:hypothetical protein
VSSIENRGSSVEAPVAEVVSRPLFQRRLVSAIDWQTPVVCWKQANVECRKSSIECRVSTAEIEWTETHPS